MIERFKGFWKDFNKSKRGIVGLTIIILYCGVALFAPMFCPYPNPNSPTLQNYYPAGEYPNIAAKLAVPVWYKYLPFTANVSENMRPIEKYTFPSAAALNQWKITSTGSTVNFNSHMGSQNDGCLEMRYGKSASAKLTREFHFPYNAPPKGLQIHISLFQTLIDEKGAESTTVNLYLEREGESYLLNSFSVPKSWWNRWYSRWVYGTETYRPPYNIILNEIFSRAGNYSFIAEVIADSEDEGVVYLDNLDLILYGNAFGLLGTDEIAGRTRDLFWSLVYGTRISLIIGGLSAAVSTILGLFLGLVAGFLRGVADEAIMRFADFLLVLPTLPLLIILIVVTGPSIWNIILLLSIMGWMGFSRSVRSMVISLRERPFVEAARAVGGGDLYIITRHILPNVFALVYITLATSVPNAIISEASLSWLGLFDPNIVSWGRVLYEFTNSGIAIKGVADYWFWVIPPGVAIALLAMAFIMMGYALDEILNPKLRERR
jgi:peptide/nickel transport system permease protein